MYKYVCSQNCIRKRALSEKVVDVGVETNYVITNLQPYTVYEIVVRVENKKLTTDSQPVTKRTVASGTWVPFPLYSIYVINESKTM